MKAKQAIESTKMQNASKNAQEAERLKQEPFGAAVVQPSWLGDGCAARLNGVKTMQLESLVAQE